MTSLREMVSQLAEKVKEVEERIESSYLTLRKTVLSQVSNLKIYVVNSLNEITLIVSVID